MVRGKKTQKEGHLGDLVGYVSNLGSGHDLTIHGFEPYIRLGADSSEPGACFGFCVSLPLSAPPPLSLSKIKFKNLKKTHLSIGASDEIGEMIHEQNDKFNRQKQ